MLTELYQSLDPVALSVGPITIYWYGVAYVVGALITGIVMYRTQRRWGLNLTVDDLMMVVFGVVIGLVIGARLFYVIFYGDGFVGGAIVCRIYHISAWTIADLAVIGVPIALCLGRCANFVNGELWGKPTDLPWGVVFGGAAGDVARHPSQLYEAFLEGVVLFVVLYLMSRRKPPLPQGTFMGTFILGYGIVRFLIEFVRVPDAQLGYILGDVITMGQLLSLPLIVIGIGLIAYALHAKRPQRDYI